MMIRVSLLLVLGVLWGLSSWAVAQDTVPIGIAKKIWDQAPHNAFTDLVRFNDRWFCVFREGKDHVSPDGALRVSWKSGNDVSALAGKPVRLRFVMQEADLFAIQFRQEKEP